MLLDIVLLGRRDLTTEVINQLKRISHFESTLHQELDKILVITNESTLQSMGELMTVVTKMNVISREVNFCSDNGQPFEPERLDDFVNQVYDYCWMLFFALYDTEKHFRYPDPNQPDSKERFK